jgi:hypothetical protein
MVDDAGQTVPMNEILLESAEEQRARGDRDIVHPWGVVVTEGKLPLFADHMYDFDHIYGSVTNVRFENGKLLGDVNYSHVTPQKVRYGIGGIVEEYTVEDGVRIITKFRLTSIGVMADRRPAQPKEEAHD